MSDREPTRESGRDTDVEVMSPLLLRAIDRLRAERSVPDDWRRGLLERLEAAKQRRRTRRRLFAVAGMAAAAAVYFAIAETYARVPAVDAGGSLHFEVSAPAAARVSLVGDFNGWNPAALPMRRSANSSAWVIDVHLPVGRHAFAYSVDGRLTIDSTAALAADDDFGVPSSVVVVSSQRSN